MLCHSSHKCMRSSPRNCRCESASPCLLPPSLLPLPCVVSLDPVLFFAGASVVSGSFTRTQCLHSPSPPPLSTPTSSGRGPDSVWTRPENSQCLRTAAGFTTTRHAGQWRLWHCFAEPLRPRVRTAARCSSANTADAPGARSGCRHGEWCQYSFQLQKRESLSSSFQSRGLFPAVGQPATVVVRAGWLAGSI